MGDQGQPKRKAGFKEVGKSPKSTSAAPARTCARGEGQHATHALVGHTRPRSGAVPLQKCFVELWHALRAPDETGWMCSSSSLRSAAAKSRTACGRSMSRYQRLQGRGCRIGTLTPHMPTTWRRPARGTFLAAESDVAGERGSRGGSRRARRPASGLSGQGRGPCRRAPGVGWGGAASAWPCGLQARFPSLEARRLATVGTALPTPARSCQHGCVWEGAEDFTRAGSASAAFRGMYWALEVGVKAQPARGSKAHL